MSAYFVLFLDGPPADWRRAADALHAASTTLALADATRACRFGMGLVPHALAEEEASAIVLSLSDAGFPAVALPATKLVLPPPAFHAQRAAITDAGFAVPVDLQGTLRTLPWDRVRVAFVAVVRPGERSVALHPWPRPREKVPSDTEAEDERLALKPLGAKEIARLGVSVATTALSAAIGAPILDVIEVGMELGSLFAHSRPQPRDAEPAVEPVPPPGPKRPEVWLELCSVSPLLRLRVRQAAFDYGCLGRRRTLSAHANFAVLLDELRARTRQATWTGCIDDVRSGREIDEHAIVEELLHEVRVTALLTRAANFGPA